MDRPLIGDAVSAQTTCLICCLPRTGSWLLAEILKSTGLAGIPEEYLREDWLWEYATNGELTSKGAVDYSRVIPLGVRRWPPAQRLDAAEFASAVSRVATTDNGVLGVKVHYGQFVEFARRYRVGGERLSVSEATLRRLFPDPRYVLLTRRDKLRQAISCCRAIQSDVWFSREPDSPPGHVALIGEPQSDQSDELDLVQVAQFVDLFTAEEESWRELLETDDGRLLQLAYEDVVADQKGAVNTVLAHLRQPPLAPGTEIVATLRQQADELTERTVERYKRWRHEARRHPWPSAAGDRNSSGSAIRTTTLIVDNFYADPGSVRDYALSLPYYYPYETDEEVASGQKRPTWMASRFRPANECPFKSSEALITALEQIIGEQIDRAHWDADFPIDEHGRPASRFRETFARTCLWNCCFQVKPDNRQRLGGGIHNHVTDAWNSVDTNGWAGIVYLSPDAPLTGGLNLWRNKDPDREWEWMTRPEEWELLDTFANVPNRLLLCRGSIPHSGAGGWGDSLETGRLFQTFFFRTVTAPVIPSLELPL